MSIILSGDSREWTGSKFRGPYQSVNPDGRGYHCGPCDDDITWDELVERHKNGHGVPSYCTCDDTEHLHCPGCDHIVVQMRGCDEGYEDEEE